MQGAAAAPTQPSRPRTTVPPSAANRPPPPPQQKNVSAVQGRASHNERPIYIAREDLLTALENFTTKVGCLLGGGVQLDECFTSLEEELLSGGQIL